MKNNKNEKWCLYTHISPSNKSYIGITKDYKKRWKSNGVGYLTKDKNGKYHQPLFANAINKYGWDNFKHYIIMDNLTQKQAFYYEKMFIKMYQTNDNKYGYNLSIGGEAIFLGRHHTQETKELISKIMKDKGVNQGEKNYFYGKPSPTKGKKMPKEFCEKISKGLRESYEKNGLSDARIKATENNRKKVNQYDMDGNLIKTWNGLGVASNELGISKENISAVCLRKKTKLGANRLSAGGYQWRFADDCDDITPYKRKEKNYSKNMYKKVARIDDDGNILEIFDGVVICAKHYNLNPNGVACVCRGIYNTTKGYKFKYI